MCIRDSVCTDELNAWVMGPCGHKLCEDCSEQFRQAHASKSSSTCPYCQRVVTSFKAIAPAAAAPLPPPAPPVPPTQAAPPLATTTMLPLGNCAECGEDARGRVDPADDLFYCERARDWEASRAPHALTPS